MISALEHRQFYIYQGNMKAHIKWLDGASFSATSGSGHEIIMDGPPEHGGVNRGVRPMETLLMGTAGCAAFDVLHILRKSRADIRACETEIEAERADTEPKVFTRIHLHFIVTGKDLKAALVERAVKLSAEKYCSASIMLGKTAQITHDFEVHEVED